MSKATLERNTASSIMAMPPVLSELSDEEMIRCFQERGDPEIFLALITRYDRIIRRFLYTLFNREDRADVEQEITLALWQSLPRFAFRSAFSTYLYRICSNTVYRYLRRTRHRASAEHSFDALEQRAASEEGRSAQGRSFAAVFADDTLQQSEHIAFVRRMLRRLKVEDRLIIHLREFELCSVEECAEILNCRVGTIKSQLHRAKKRLERILEAHIGGETA